MSRKTYGAGEIVGILRNIEILKGKGKSMSDCCGDKGISVAIYYRLKKEYPGLHPVQAKRLKEQERENGRLKKLLAEV